MGNAAKTAPAQPKFNTDVIEANSEEVSDSEEVTGSDDFGVN